MLKGFLGRAWCCSIDPLGSRVAGLHLVLVGTAPLTVRPTLGVTLPRPQAVSRLVRSRERDSDGRQPHRTFI